MESSFPDLPPVNEHQHQQQQQQLQHVINPPPQPQQQQQVQQQPFSGNSLHPPYHEMILAAICGLKDKDGSSRQAIAKYIEKEFTNLPPTHATLLTHHLKRMKNEGELVMVKHSYMLPPPPGSAPFQPTVDHHFTDYTVTVNNDGSNTVGGENPYLSPRRKPGRPSKPRQDFGFQVHHQDGQQMPPAAAVTEIHAYQPQFEHHVGITQDFQPQNTHMGQQQDHYGGGAGQQEQFEGNNVAPAVAGGEGGAGGTGPIFASLGLADDGVAVPLPPPSAPESTPVVSAKRGRGRPPKSTAGAVTGSASAAAGSAAVGSAASGGSVGGAASPGGAGDVVKKTERRKPGRPKSMSVSKVNGGKRDRPKRLGGSGGPVAVPLSGDGTKPRGRPKRSTSGPLVVAQVNGGGESSSASRGRGRPPKRKFRKVASKSFGRPSKAGPGTAVIVTDPHQLVAYQELKSKYEHLQSKAKEVMGVVKPYINPNNEAFGALQELELMVGVDANVQSEKPPSSV